jgi:hypothetical protein
LYKQVLAGQPDSSVTIIITGYATNVAQLLLLPGGMDLVRKKVRMVVQMGGGNECCCGGKEGNLWVDALSSKIMADSLPVPMVYSGFSVGAQTNTGAGFRNQPTTRPARAVFAGSNFSRSSWDPCATLFAMAGFGPTSKPYFKIGSNTGYQTINMSDSGNKYICTDVPGKAPRAFISMIGDPNQSDPNLVRVLDSLYGLASPPITGTVAAQNVKNNIFRVSLKGGILTTSGIDNGIIELYDEMGRLCQKTAIINNIVVVTSKNKNPQVLLYKIKQMNRSIAYGTITTQP